MTPEQLKLAVRVIQKIAVEREAARANARRIAKSMYGSMAATNPVARYSQTKEAGSRMRSIFKLINPDRSPIGKNQSFRVALGNKPIGSVTVGRPASGDLEIASVILDKKFQGMGLGKKLYGELMRMAESGHINSPPRRSIQAANLWQSIRKRPNDYTVTEVMTPLHQELPSLRARLTKSSPRKSPIAREWDDRIDSY